MSISYLIVSACAISAFDVEKVKQEITVELANGLTGGFNDHPVLILIGGYPGAGKTTLIHALTQVYDFDVISWNAIRQALLDRKLQGSPYDGEIIHDVNRKLLYHCLQRHSNVVIDANAYAKNIKRFEQLLHEMSFQDQYRVVKICLNPPFDVLLSRIRARISQEGVHQGTESDLIRDVHSEYKKMDLNDYSLIIKNDEEISFETERNIVLSFLQPYFSS